MESEMNEEHGSDSASPSPADGRSVGVEPSAAQALAPVHPAIENLSNCQRQLDMDGCEVGVSRQALDETLEITRELLAAAKAVAAAQEDTSGIDFTGWCQRLGDETAKLRAAIAKAEGAAQ